MASKGVTKNGEALCMNCGAGVDPGAVRCEACYSQLDQEVKAFRCPRCESALELGTQQCGKCGMRFKAKTIRTSDAAEDDRILERLISFGRRGADRSSAVASTADTPPAPTLSSEEEAAVRDLVGQMTRLATRREELASGMAARLSNARDRLARISRASPSGVAADDIESELKAVVEDLACADEVVASAAQLAQGLAHALSLPGVVALTKGRDLGSAAHGLSARAAGAVPGDLLEREEKVRMREEMVDRKIKAYAQKKKQLDAKEARMAAGASPEAVSPPAPAVPRELVDKVRSIHELVSSNGSCDDLEPCLSSLERQVRDLVSARSELEQRIAQFQEGEDEVRRLLKALDGLLDQLPSDVVDGFSKSDEFRLYERVLDRLRI